VAEIVAEATGKRVRLLADRILRAAVHDVGERGAKLPDAVAGDLDRDEQGRGRIRPPQTERDADEAGRSTRPSRRRRGR
jgi:hypothetical protein